MIARTGFAGSFGGLRHALAYAGEIRRRCVVNRESAASVAKSLRLDTDQTLGVSRLMRACPRLSPERLALVAMRDWGLDDSDIASIFGRSERWAAVVRSQADEIRAEEPVPPRLEYLDSGLQPGDPSPSEVLERAEQLRVAPGWRGDRATPPAMPAYSWRGDAFICQGFE